jgi:hypothetical protein
MSGHDWGDVIALVFVLALFLILTRASSNAPTIIATLGTAFAHIISFATDSGTASAGTSAGAGIGSLG